MARIDPCTPKNIRKFVAAQLASRLAVAYPSLTIYQGRPRPGQTGDDPQLNVFSEGNDGTNRSVHVADLDVVERVNVWGSLKLPEGGLYDDAYEAVSDLLDDLEFAIKDALLTSRVIVATFRKILGASSTKEVNVEGEDMRSVVGIQFRFERTETWEPREEAGDPDGDLEQLDITVQVGSEAYLLRPIYRDRWVTHDGDDVVTHEPENIVTHLSQGYDG